MFSRQDFLDFNINFLYNAIKDVKPGGDLAPQLSFIDANEQIHVAILELMPETKDAIAEAIRRLLREKGALIYAMILASWTVKTDNLDQAEAKRVCDLVARYGTGHPDLIGRRTEAYMVTVGDRDGSTIACFDVERDWKGRIRKLTRQPDEGMFSGRFADLLTEPRH